MSSISNIWIYPCAFNPCILRCSNQNGNPTYCLYMEHTCDTLYVSLDFSSKVFEGDGSIFRCDLMSARDGGLPFLIVTNVISLCGKSNPNVSSDMSSAMFLPKTILENPEYFNMSSTINEYRVRPPTFLLVEQCEEMMTYLIPNFYGIANGFAFARDKCFPLPTKQDDNVFVVRKTPKTEVYEIFIDGYHPVSGNNTLYIPTLDMSRKLKALFHNKNSVKVHCVFDERRQKWSPNI